MNDHAIMKIVVIMLRKKINTLLESVLSIPGINTILKYIKIYKKSYFKLYNIYIYIYIYIYI